MKLEDKETMITILIANRNKETDKAIVVSRDGSWSLQNAIYMVNIMEVEEAISNEIDKGMKTEVAIATMVEFIEYQANNSSHNEEPKEVI